MTLVKVCGLRSLEEATAALEAGANLLGFILWRPGKRYVPPSDAAAIIETLRSRAKFSAVGVFVDPTRAEVDDAVAACDFDLIQLSGDESPDFVASMPQPTVKAIHVREGKEAAAIEAVETNAFRARHYLLDTHGALPGGNGTSFDWHALQSIGTRCLVAGGLRPDNVRTALATLEPLGVDVSSGVEYPGGGKDPILIRAFVEAVRAHDSHCR